MFEDTSLEAELSRLLLNDGCTINKHAIRHLAEYIENNQMHILDNLSGKMENMKTNIKLNNNIRDRNEPSRT